jgi:phage gpG-like protein
MKNPVRSQMLGLPEFKAQLNRLSDAANADTLANAVTAGLLLIQNVAAKKAPYRTGTLSRSIHSEILEKRRNYAIGAVGTDVVYGPIQEFGGVVKNAFGMGAEFSVTIPAHPYMRPAWDEQIDAAIREIKESLVDMLKVIK